ncbi:M48 family metallopeptidase [Arhodomonas sp. AD133]|uniref:M48 family metallopeptidase n=1 Tax=Arhodomonas sp. AD133 TaxID=3415009 RepID=UPI003EC12199
MSERRDLAGSLTVEGVEIPVRYRVQRRRSIALHLYPGPSIEVRLPRGCPNGVVRRFLDSRVDWVAKRLETLPPLRRLEAGAPQALLGSEYPLRPVRAARYDAVIRNGALWLFVPALDERRLERGLQRFYRQQAERVFAERLALWCDRLAGWGIGRPALRLRRMRRRWGSCSTRGEVTLNVHLIQHSIELIDLVVVHELCHLLEFNHSPRFYALMDAALPDWRKRDAVLNRKRAG